MAAHNDTAFTSFSPSIPSYFPNCRLKCGKSVYHESFKDTIIFFKVTIQYMFELDLTGSCLYQELLKCSLKPCKCLKWEIRPKPFTSSQ